MRGNTVRIIVRGDSIHPSYATVPYDAYEHMRYIDFIFLSLSRFTSMSVRYQL